LGHSFKKALHLYKHIYQCATLSSVDYASLPKRSKNRCYVIDLFVCQLD